MAAGRGGREVLDDSLRLQAKIHRGHRHSFLIVVPDRHDRRESFPEDGSGVLAALLGAAVRVMGVGAGRSGVQGRAQVRLAQWRALLLMMMRRVECVGSDRRLLQADDALVPAVAVAGSGRRGRTGADFLVEVRGQLAHHHRHAGSGVLRWLRLLWLLLLFILRRDEDRAALASFAVLGLRLPRGSGLWGFGRAGDIDDQRIERSTQRLHAVGTMQTSLRGHGRGEELGEAAGLGRLVVVAGRRRRGRGAVLVLLHGRRPIAGTGFWCLVMDTRASFLAESLGGLLLLGLVQWAASHGHLGKRGERPIETVEKEGVTYIRIGDSIVLVEDLVENVASDRQLEEREREREREKVGRRVS